MRKTIFLSIIFVLIVVGGATAFFLYTRQTPSAVNQQPPSSNEDTSSAKTQPTATEKCVASSCHYYGSDTPLECAPESAKPKMCTEEYRVGDNCLGLVKCESVDGTCKAIETPEFKECIKKAEKQGLF